METSHGMSFQLIWDFTVATPTNIQMRRVFCCVFVCLFLFCSSPQLQNDKEDQSKHYM